MEVHDIRKEIDNLVRPYGVRDEVVQHEIPVIVFHVVCNGRTICTCLAEQSLPEFAFGVISLEYCFLEPHVSSHKDRRMYCI